MERLTQENLKEYTNEVLLKIIKRGNENKVISIMEKISQDSKFTKEEKVELYEILMEFNNCVRNILTQNVQKIYKEGFKQALELTQNVEDINTSSTFENIIKNPKITKQEREHIYKNLCEYKEEAYNIMAQNIKNIYEEGFKIALEILEREK